MPNSIKGKSHFSAVVLPHAKGILCLFFLQQKSSLWLCATFKNNRKMIKQILMILIV